MFLIFQKAKTIRNQTKVSCLQKLIYCNVFDGLYRVANLKFAKVETVQDRCQLLFKYPMVQYNKPRQVAFPPRREELTILSIQ